MGRISTLLDDVRSRINYTQQPVYDPTYIYSPWKKWVLVFAVLLGAALVTYGLNRNIKNPDNGQDFSIQSDSRQSSSQPGNNEKYYQVTKVIDGDTIDVSIDGKIERIRLIGIDTPETVDPRKTVQCFGKEATAAANKLLGGASVRLEADATQDNMDKYNRLLRYVYLKDGKNFNKYMIYEGYAHEYTYTTPYKFQLEFIAAEKDAENNNRGLWSPSSCSGNTDSTPTPALSDPTVPAPAAVNNSNCDPSYTPCVPNVTYDLDCGDISLVVHVIGTDRHRFDRDGDGIGCESN